MTDYNNFMLDAYFQASHSRDPSTQNGAVLLRTIAHRPLLYRVIGNGYNDFPPGVPESFFHGEKEAKYARVVHAEVAAILDAAKRGNSAVGSTLVCPWAACSNCAKHIAAAGVSTLVRHSYSNSGVTTGSHWYADCLIGDEIFRDCGVEIVEIDPVPSDIKLRRNGSLWTSEGNL